MFASRNNRESGMAGDRESEDLAPELSEFEQLLRAKKMQRDVDRRRGAPLFKISPVKELQKERGSASTPRTDAAKQIVETRHDPFPDALHEARAWPEGDPPPDPGPNRPVGSSRTRPSSACSWKPRPASRPYWKRTSHTKSGHPLDRASGKNFELQGYGYIVASKVTWPSPLK